MPSVESIIADVTDATDTNSRTADESTPLWNFLSSLYEWVTTTDGLALELAKWTIIVSVSSTLSGIIASRISMERLKP